MVVEESLYAQGTQEADQKWQWEAEGERLRKRWRDGSGMMSTLYGQMPSDLAPPAKLPILSSDMDPLMG